MTTSSDHEEREMLQAQKMFEDSEVEDRRRVTEGFRARLRARSIAPHESDSLEDLGMMLEAIEYLELAIVEHGGDLMVDEPPPGAIAEPDDPEFALPTRGPNESAGSYTSRVRQAIRRVRKHH